MSKSRVSKIKKFLYSTYVCGGGHCECESIWKSINIGFKLFDNNTDCLKNV